MELEISIVSGMSGAGKSTVLGVLEDTGYFCMDNVPPDLLLELVSLMKHPSMGKKRLAAVVDVRTGKSFEGLKEVIMKLRKAGVKVHIIFLDAKDEVLLNRYNLTRRRHPLSDGHSSLSELIKKERALLSDIRDLANYKLDTSLVNPHELRQKILEIIEGKSDRSLKLILESFGFKYGIPISADFVFDARFLPNPYYIEELKSKNGTDPEVATYFEKFDVMTNYISDIVNLIDLVIENYSKEAKDVLYISVGCSGGVHRSVYIVQKLASIFKSKVNISVSHRDLSR